MAIHLDFETYSELDLRQVGSFKYAEHPSTEVLCMCWSYDDGPVLEWHPGQFINLLLELFNHISNGEEVGAHNAMFEYCIWNTVLQRHLPKHIPKLQIKQLNCTAARAAMCSLPRALERAGAALRLDITKDKRGAKLLQLFSKPRKPTKNDSRTRNFPKDFPKEFQELIQYCKTDVSSERELNEALPPLPQFERMAFRLNFIVNERGIPIDIHTVRKALTVVFELEQRVKKRVTESTKGIAPTQRDKLMGWLAAQGYEMENLQAATVKALLDNTEIKISPKVREILLLRIEASRTSTKKLVSMRRVACSDDRARGTILYYGAHTGREAGKLVQPQNFIRGLPDPRAQTRLMNLIFGMLTWADADVFELIFDNPLFSIAQCMRGFIKVPKGRRLMVVDYAQIEARLLVWLAGQADAVEEYRQYDNGSLKWDRYVLMAAFLWSIKPEDVTDDQRRIAKNLVLGCGFQLGWRKFIVYCAKNDMVIDEQLSKHAVGAFREKHKEVVQYWEDVNRCAISSVRNSGRRIHLRQISFLTNKEYLTVRLPSGRDLYYPEPQVGMKEVKSTKGKVIKIVPELSFMDEHFGKWMRSATYGGRLVENIVQGTARDILLTGALNAERAKYPIVLQVHDELLAEVENHEGNLQELEKIVCNMPPWVKECPINAKGFEVQRYRKG